MSGEHRNPVIRPLIKFTVYGVVCLLMLAGLATRVGNLHSLPLISHNHTFYAELPDASSLVAPDDVKIAGVTVGQVKSVKVKRGHAVVKFVVHRGLVLRQSTEVGMRFQNVIGEKYLYLYPGSSGAAMKPGSTIPIAQSVGSADVGDFLADIGAFLKALNPNDVNAFTAAIVSALQNNDSQINRLLANTADVAGTVGGLDTHVASVIDNLEQVLSALAARNSDLAAVADHLSSVSQELAARNDVLDNLVTNFANVNSELNQLIGGNRQNLDQTITNLQTIAGVLAQHHGDLENDLATLPQGLESYTLISQFGQWFNIRVVYTCLAQQTSCTYEDPAHPPASLDNPHPPIGSPTVTTNAAPGSAVVSGQAGLNSIVGFALNGNAS
jgi:phospholipid/cholesterol/gamma-HCH transport system substrate-binding protein